MTRTFRITVPVNPALLRDAPDLTRQLAGEWIRNHAAKPLVGPRGGRYEVIGEPYDFADSPDADPYFTRNIHVFAARVDARYVRPRR